MSNDNNHDTYDAEKPIVIRKEMSRRQFLAYTLGGTGAFLAAGPLIPMLRFAVDPILQKKDAAGWVKVVEESKISETPTSIDFTAHQIDGWYESNPTFTAWISRDKEGKIFALSPVCKHLGCLINWGTDKAKPDQYQCPCHDAHYSKDGKNLTIAPSPLDEYDVKLDNGFVYLGGIKSNTRV